MSDLIQKFALILGFAIGSAFLVAGHSTMAQGHFMKPDSMVLPKIPSRT